MIYRTWDSFICMLANTCKKPTTASHSLLWAKLCWFPIHGPWRTERWWENIYIRWKYIESLHCIYLTVLTEGSSSSYLNILSQWVEYLLGNRQSFGEVEFSSLVDDIFAGVVPVEVTDGFLNNRITLADADDGRVCACILRLCIYASHTWSRSR